MGCHSSKASVPSGAAKLETAERTLLRAGPSNSETEAVKENADRTLLGTSPNNSEIEAIKETAVEGAGDADKPVHRGFEGRWSAGKISGIFMTWADGRVSQIQYDDVTKKAEISLDGDKFSGELRDDDQIYWSDGDVWKRHQVCSGFVQYEGMVDHGPSLLIQTMTVEDAKCKASAMPNCVGFTFEGPPTDDLVKVYFKSQWQLVGTVATSYRLEEVQCAVGDAVMAEFAPSGKRYAATIAAIAPDNTITVDWKDSCKTHRVLPPSKVFKDVVAPPKQEEATPVAKFPSVEKPSRSDNRIGADDKEILPDAKLVASDGSRFVPPSILDGEQALSTSVDRSLRPAPVEKKEVRSPLGDREQAAVIASMPHLQKRKEKYCCC